MVQDVVNEIVSAEKKAQKLLEAALKKAEVAITSAEIEAQNRLDHARVSAKQYVKERAEKSYQEAEINASALMDAKKEEVALTISHASKNLDKAVKYVIDKVLA